MHRHNASRRDPLRNGKRFFRIHRIVSADGQEQRIAPVQRGKGALLRHAAGVAHVDNAQSAEAELPDRVHPAARAAVVVVRHGKFLHGDIVRSFHSNLLHARRSAVVAVAVRAVYRPGARTKRRKAGNIAILIGVDHDGILPILHAKARVAEPLDFYFIHASVSPFAPRRAALPFHLVSPRPAQDRAAGRASPPPPGPASSRAPKDRSRSRRDL